MKKRKTIPDGGTREGWNVLVFTLKYEISKQIDPLFYTFSLHSGQHPPTPMAARMSSCERVMELLSRAPSTVTLPLA